MQKQVWLLVFIMLLLGCKQEEPPPVFPTISFSTGDGVLSSNREVPPRSQWQIRVIAGKSDSPLASLLVLENGLPLTEYRDSGTYFIPESFQNTLRDTISVVMPDGEEQVATYEFVLTDQSGKEARAILRFTTRDPIIDSFFNIRLYAQGPFTPQDTLDAAGRVMGGFWWSKENRVIDSANAQPLGLQIDLSFGVGNDSLPVLIAPGRRNLVQGLNILSGGNVAAFDTTSLSFTSATGTDLFNATLGDSALIAPVVGQNILWRNFQRRRGIIRVNNVFQDADQPKRAYVDIDIKLVR